MMKYSPFQDEPGSNDNNGQNAESQVQNNAPKHPVAVFFHLFFKIVAVAVFILSSFVNIGFVLTFIIVTMSSAFDFWVTKNVTGRKLVGLRWWNQIRDDGSNNWVFESVQDKSQVNPAESLMFWIPVLAFAAGWFVFAIISLFGLSFLWLVVEIVCFLLAGANLLGYIKCAKDARKKVKGMAQSYIVGTIVNQAINRV
ncbi:hypothetical protein RB653_002686 [Dictyostelium firmibasis]|uniref:Golgi apparatus membrane protein TVP23 homolog n=1 Tax=Dictyostelium firmibasis TaxID=79012 RepID=A0AAN7TY02_9MYCE